MSRNNQVSTIKVPKFANLTTGMSSYQVHITLCTTKEAAEYIKNKKYSNVEVFFWKKCWRVRVNHRYTYDTSLEYALYERAYKTLAHLKILLREAEIANLKEEIDLIKENYD